MHLSPVVSAGLACLLVACPKPVGPTCGSGNQCPVNDYCLFGQCTAPGTVSRNLSAVVYPSDPALAPQQFLPADLVAQDRYLVMDLRAPEQLTGSLSIQGTGCDAGDAYPIHFHFTQPSAIPSLSENFDFDDLGLPGSGGPSDGGPGDGGPPPIALLGVLPSLQSFQLRVTTATACTPPIVGQQDTLPGLRDVRTVGIGPFPAVAATLGISGTVGVPSGAPLPVGAAVRIRSPASVTGGSQVISVDGLLSMSPIDGGLQFSLPIDPAQALATPCSLGSCTSFVVEVSSNGQPVLPTFELPVLGARILDAGPLGDSGTSSGVYNLNLQLPIPISPTFPLAVSASDPANNVLTSQVVTVESGPRGLMGCDGGCAFLAHPVTDATGGFTLPLLPGDYTLSMTPPPPLGAVTLALSIVPTSDGGLALISSQPPAGDGGLLLVAAPANRVNGSILEPDGETPLRAGQIEVLTLPELQPVAIQQVDGGLFDIAVPPGNDYLLLVQPDESTRFPTFYTTFDTTLSSNGVVSFPHLVLLPPGQLTGIVRAQQLSGPPLPVAAALVEFFFVTSDLRGQPVAFPVASAVTDSEGNWSAPGPPTE